MSTNPNLSRYLSRCHSPDPLTAEQEAALVAEYHAAKKDPTSSAAKALVASLLRCIVVNAAKIGKSDPQRIDDLVSEGTIAAYRALKKFDPAFGVRLVSYAKHDIRQRMFRFMRRNRHVANVSSHVQVAPDVSLDAPAQPERGADSETRVGFLVGPLSAPDDLTDLADAFDVLSTREREVLEQTILVGFDNEELGREYGMTRERVRQIQERAIRKVRRYYKGIQRMLVRPKCHAPWPINPIKLDTKRNRRGDNARKLTKQQANDARVKYKNTDVTQGQLALEYGMTLQNMQLLLAGKTYRDVA